MKAKISTSKPPPPPPKFKPVTIEVTLETEFDLYALWNRLNIPYATVKDVASHGYSIAPFCDKNDTYPLFDVVDDIAEDFAKQRSKA